MRYGGPTSARMGPMTNGFTPSWPSYSVSMTAVPRQHQRGNVNLLPMNNVIGNDIQMSSTSEVGRYRTGAANLLGNLVGAVGEIEQCLDVDVEGDEAAARAVLEGDPTGPFRITCALLLRKAKIRMIAMLRANQNSNVHSLAVQMRPVLECAGQVVFVLHNLMIEPERGESVVLGYMNADYYGTFIRLTKGEVSEVSDEHLLSDILELNEMSKEKVGKGKSLRQADKLAALNGGLGWYNYLSERFCHGEADWRGLSWRGDVISMDTVQDAYTFAGLMDYLVNQVALMNAYVALFSVAGDMAHERVEAAVTQLQEVRTTTKALRDAAGLAFGNPSQKSQD